MTAARLREIVDKAYELFRRYPARLPLDICTDCCMDPGQASAMASMAVRQIPAEFIYEYNTAAKTAKPNLDEVRHFLPRTLELIASFQEVHHSTELFLARLEVYEQAEWQPEESELLREFAFAMFDECLRRYPVGFRMHNSELSSEESILSIFIMLRPIGVEVGALLEHWSTVREAAAARHLSNLLTHGFGNVRRTKLNNSFADEELAAELAVLFERPERFAHLAPIIEQLIPEPEEISDYEQKMLSWTFEWLQAGNSASA